MRKSREKEVKGSRIVQYCVVLAGCCCYCCHHHRRCTVVRAGARYINGCFRQVSRVLMYQLITLDPNHSFLPPPPYNSPTNPHTHAYTSCSPSHILSVVADLVKSFHVALADLKRKALVAAKQAAKEAAKVAAKEVAKGAVKTGGKRKARE